MSDSRVFTDYRPNCTVNEELQKTYGTANIHAYRHYLQANAEKIMADTQIGAKKCTTCPACGLALDYKPSGDITKQL
jgi:hypothetical protein